MGYEHETPKSNKERAERNRRERNTDQLKDQEMQVYSMFLMGALAGGNSLKGSTDIADKAIAHLKSRYC